MFSLGQVHNGVEIQKKKMGQKPNDRWVKISVKANRNPDLDPNLSPSFSLVAYSPLVIKVRESDSPQNVTLVLTTRSNQVNDLKDFTN